MRVLFFDHLRNARQSLRSNRMRTILTVAGVAIGIASITVILSLSAGVVKIINGQVESLGGNIAVVRPNAPQKRLNDLSNPAVQQAFSTSTITEKDANDIRSLPGVAAAAPLMLINGTVGSKDGKTKVGTVVASTMDLPETVDLPVASGQFFDDMTDEQTAVIGAQLSIDTFGTEQSLGKTLNVRGKTFRVIGVLERLNDPINYTTIDFDRAVIITLESGKAFHEGMAQIQQVNVRAETVAELPGVVTAMKKTLDTNHLGEADTVIMQGEQIAMPTNQFFRGITTVMVTIAAISLIVGGVGIMNIMLVGVAERTREIGLRKAVGASSGNIVSQFLTESLLMSAVGGLIGYVSGYVIAFIISTFLTFDPAFTWPIAVLAFGTALLVGGLFGLYPAIRAARKDPIESLRHYH
jgi:ABC-type antimicrobial peptide transport system permease subunit